jgi:hypothetical protein
VIDFKDMNFWSKFVEINQVGSFRDKPYPHTVSVANLEKEISMNPLGQPPVARCGSYVPNADLAYYQANVFPVTELTSLP